MKKSQEAIPPFISEPADPLLARLIRRHTHAVGIIDTYHTQKHYYALVGWLTSRFPLLAQLTRRSQSGDGQALRPEEMIYQNPPWQFGHMAKEQGPSSNQDRPSIPTPKEIFPKNLNAIEPHLLPLPNVPENQSGHRDLINHGDIDDNQEEPLGTIWRLRRATSQSSLNFVKGRFDKLTSSLPANATSINRKASHNQPVKNIADNTENDNRTGQDEQALSQPNKIPPTTRFFQKQNLEVDFPSMLRQSNRESVRSSKPLIFAKAEQQPVLSLPAETLPKVKQWESSTQPKAGQNQNASNALANRQSCPSKAVKTRELTNPEIPKPDLFIAQSPKGNLRTDANALTKPGSPQGTDELINNLPSENHKDKTTMTSSPPFTEVITPNPQTMNSRFSKTEWTQLIDAVSKIIGDKLLTDLDRRGIRLWR